SLGLLRAGRLQLRPRLLAHGGTGPRGCGADDGTRHSPADRRTERPRIGHRHCRVPDQGPRGQRVRTGRRTRLPNELDDLARSRVRDDLLPDPRPRAEGPQRGRVVATLDPPTRRVRQRVTARTTTSRAFLPSPWSPLQAAIAIVDVSPRRPK